jgi:hypothetical protein
MSLSVRHHVLHLKKKLKDDSELTCLSSSSAPYKRIKSWQQVRSLPAHRHLLHLKKKTKRQWRAKKLVIVVCTWEKNQEMTTSFLAHCHLLDLRKKPKDIQHIPCSLPTFFNSWRKQNKCKLLWLYCGVLTTA